MANFVELYPIDIENGLFEMISVITAAIKISDETGRVVTECSFPQLPDTLMVSVNGTEFEFVKDGGAWKGTIANPIDLLSGASISGFTEVTVKLNASPDALKTLREKTLEAIIVERDSILADTDFLVVRHRDQLDTGTPTTLSAEQYAELLTYRQTLRDFPTTVDFDNVVWPTPPSFL